MSHHEVILIKIISAFINQSKSKIKVVPGGLKHLKIESILISLYFRFLSPNYQIASFNIFRLYLKFKGVCDSDLTFSR